MISIEEISVKYGNEVALMTLACRAYYNSDQYSEVSRFISSRKFDYHLFFEVCDHFELVPIVYKALETCPNLPGKSIFEKFRLRSLEIAFLNLKMVNEIVRITKLLTEYSLQFCFFKGVMQSKELFGDFVARDCCDMDLLIRETDYQKVIEILYSDGYSFIDANDSRTSPNRYSNEVILLKSDKAVNDLAIEVHWRPVLSMLKTSLDTRKLLERRIFVQVNGAEVPYVDPGDSLLMMVVHHGVSDVWRTPKHIVDLTAYLCRTDKPYWDQLETRLRRYGILKTFLAGSLIAQELIGINIPSTFRQILLKSSVSLESSRLIEKMLSYPLKQKNKLSLDSFRTRFSLRDSSKDRIMLTLNYLIYRPYFIFKSIGQSRRLPSR